VYAMTIRLPSCAVWPRARGHQRLRGGCCLWRWWSKAPSAPRRRRLAGWIDRRFADWVHRFNAEGPEGLYDRRGPGPACRLSDEQQQELAAIIEAGPDLAEHGVVRWRLRDLCAWVEKRFGVSYHEQGLSKLIKRLGFRRISARPQHPKSDPEIQAAFKKTSLAWSRTRSATVPLIAR